MWSLLVATIISVGMAAGGEKARNKVNYLSN